MLDAPSGFGKLFDQVVDLLDGYRANRLALGHLLGVDDLVANWSLADIRSLRGQAACRPGC